MRFGRHGVVGTSLTHSCSPAPPLAALSCTQLGHAPQEDYPEAIQETLEAFLAGETDSWPMGKVVQSKMSKN